MRILSMSDFESPPPDYDKDDGPSSKPRILLPTSFGWALGALVWIVLFLLIYWIVRR